MATSVGFLGWFYCYCLSASLCYYILFGYVLLACAVRLLLIVSPDGVYGSYVQKLECIVLEH